MTKSTLLGYTVEREDDKIVITLSGSMADDALQTLVRNSRLFPDLNSKLIEMATPQAQAVPAGEDGGKLDLQQIFGQGFDRNHADFDRQLAEFRRLLTNGSNATNDTNVRGRRSSKKKRRAK